MSKKIILLFVFLLSCCLGLTAQNTMSLTSAEGAPYDVLTIELSLSNAESFVAFQTEIPLGENLTYVANSASLYRDADHQLVASVVEGTLKLYAFSLSGQAFSGNEGKIASFQLELGIEPGTFPLTNTKAKIVDAAGNALQLTTNDGTVLVKTPKAVITTPQINYGHVPIRTTYNKTLSVKNAGNEPLTISGLQFSDATLSCPSFSEKVISAGSSTYFTIVYSPVEAGAVNYTITVVSDASNGDQTAQVSADPYSVNELHLARTNGYCDSIINFDISMNNMDAITGFQFCVKMPSALQYQTGSMELTSRKTDHICTANMRNDTLVVLAYSPTNAAFSGNDGIVASLKLMIKGNNGSYYLYPKNTVLADAQGKNVLSDDYYGYVTVRSPKISTISIHTFASSSVTDKLTETFEINNNGNAPLRIDSVKFNDEYLSCETELPLVISQYSNANISLCCNKSTEGEIQSTMKIYSNDPTNGMLTVKVLGNRYEPNGLTIDNEDVVSDEYLDVLINMDNYSEITAIQADFSYPYLDYSLQSSDFSLTERSQGFSMSATQTNDSTFKIIMFSFNNAILSGNEGAVIKVRMNRKEDSECKNVTLSLKNIILSDVNGNNKDSEGNQIKKIELITKFVRELKQGWNWFSTNLNISGEDGLYALQYALGSNAKIIKSQTEFTLYYEEQNVWDGSLNAIYNNTFYMINMSNPMNLELQGFLTDMSQYEITIKKGWNWINYSNNDEMSVNDVDFGFTPVEGDLIKSQTEFTRYYESFGWDGSLQSLKTGEAYMYYSNDENNKTMSFE